MSRTVAPGSVDVSTVIRIVDSVDGTPENGVTSGSAGLALWYRREGGLKVTITPAALTNLNDAHSDGGILLISDGYYRLDVPDAAFAAGAAGVAIAGTVTGMVIIGAYHQLIADPLTPTTAGRTLTVEADGMAHADLKEWLGAAPSALITGRVDANAQAVGDKTGYALSAAGIQAIWDALTSALITAGSVGKRIADNLDAAITSRMATFTLPANFAALSITAGGLVDITQAAADKVWATATRTLTGAVDLSAAALAAIWDRLTSALTTAGSIGKLLVDNVNATIGSRLSTPQGIRKNTALTAFEFVMFDSTGDPKTGLTGFTKQVSLDGAAFVNLANAVAEVGSGTYRIDLAAGETNGEVITYRFAAAGAKDTLITIRTVSP